MKYIITLTLLCFGLSCSLESNRAPLESHPTDKTVVLRPVDARIDEAANSVVNARVSRINSELKGISSIRKAQFVTAQKGWADSPGYLYRTADGGATWSRLTFPLDDESVISSVTFIDESRGWLAVTKQRWFTERYGLGNSSQIWATNDGGDTWHKQADFTDEVRVRQISFLNANEGFAIGARLIDQPRDIGPPYAEILILSTSDAGRTWTDSSEGLKEELRRQTGSTADSGWSIHWRTPTNGFLLTRSARIIRTSDKGNTWETIVKLKHAPNVTNSPIDHHKLVFDASERIGVIAGAYGDEGYWGDFVVAEDDKSWRSYELKRTPINDAIFLSQDEVVACGEILQSLDGKRPEGGIILHSTDSGKSWQVIYRSKSPESFVSLTKINERQFYAVSNHGTFLSFELK